MPIGFAYGDSESLTIPGLVLDPIDWGTWDLNTQRTKVSGLLGETALNTLRGGRDISCEMFVWNSYASLNDLMAALFNVDALSGTVGTVYIINPLGGTDYTLANCEIRPVHLIKNRSDGVHRYWARCRIQFRQLTAGGT